MRMIRMCLAIECSNNLRMSFLLALINDHRVSAGDKIADWARSEAITACRKLASERACVHS